MYLAIEPQPDCVAAWREAVRAVDVKHGHEYSNVIIDVQNPIARSTLQDPVVAAVNDFVVAKGEKAIETVANTIFPAALYRRYGEPALYDRFLNNVLPKIRNKERWSGYYFERMISVPQPNGPTFNQLADIIGRLKDPQVKARNKFELSVFDPVRDVDRSPYGGQCMSFASFKKRNADGIEYLDLTAMYRNHFYIEKLLGNIIGLGRLMKFVSDEAGIEMGSLTIVSTHAEIDQPGHCSRADINDLLARCDMMQITT